MGLKDLLNSPIIYQKFQEAGGFFAARVTSIGEYLSLKNEQCVIDVGCGPGFIVNNLPKGTTYHGFDIEQKYIDYARRHFSARGSFYCQEFDGECAAAVGPADVVMMNGLIHHLDQQNALATLRAARDALRLGGILFTLDGCFRDGQSPIAHWLARKDRGKFVRDQVGYHALLSSVFDDVTIHIREDLSRIPYTFAVGLARIRKGQR